MKLLITFASAAFLSVASAQVAITSDPSAPTTTYNLTVNADDVVNVTKRHVLMGPPINDALIPPPNIAAVYNTDRVQPVPAGCNQANPATSDVTQCDTNVWIAYPSDIGAFRDPCGLPYEYAYDDPVVHPGKPGASHLHAVYGNTNFSAYATQATLLEGNSTCAGGTLFRSSLWVPATIDQNGAPVPLSLNYYQKGSYDWDISGFVQPIPAGLRFIATSGGRFACGSSAWFPNIPQAIASGQCVAGARFFESITFPTCWDGKNLDSPDHVSHTATLVQDQSPPFAKHCPADHPVVLPTISYQLEHTIKPTEQPELWGLSSDMDRTQPAGYSFHGDYWANVDPATEATLVQNCIAGKRDGHDYLLCDGRTLY